MKDSDGPTWLLRIQNAFLPLAKGIYLLVAIGSLITVIGGSLFALYLQYLTSRSVETVLVPPPYPESPANLGPVPAMDFSLVNNHLEPPTNITFIVTIDTITAPLREEDSILGYFLVDTSNGLAPFPDGITFLGGRDATLFERTFDQKHKETGLKATAALIKEINETLRDIHEQKERNFEIQVVAQDRYGMLSDLTTISFPLRFGPKSLPPRPRNLQGRKLPNCKRSPATLRQSLHRNQSPTFPNTAGRLRFPRNVRLAIRVRFSSPITGRLLTKCAPASRPIISRPFTQDCAIFNYETQMLFTLLLKTFALI